MGDGDRPEIGAFVDAGGVKTNYLESGEGAPVVLIHGSGPGVTAYANWRLVIPDLARHFRVLAPDMAGFGYSDKPGNYTMAGWVNQIISFLDALNLKQASLVGNSFGGALALRMAIDQPGRVDRFVLMGAMGIEFPITEGLEAGWGYEPSIENMRRTLEFFTYNHELITDELVEVRYRAALEPGVQEAFAQIPHEALIIHGRDDQVIPLENAYRLLRLIPRSELHVFGRCGHWSQIDWADEFNAQLIRFFGRKAR